MSGSILVRQERSEFEAWKSEVFGNITANYTALGTPVTKPVRILGLHNYTDENVGISFDGVSNHWPVGTGAVIDNGSNGIVLPAGTQIYIKHLGAAPTTGTFIASIISAK